MSHNDDVSQPSAPVCPMPSSLTLPQSYNRDPYATGKKASTKAAKGELAGDAAKGDDCPCDAATGTQQQKKKSSKTGAAAAGTDAEGAAIVGEEVAPEEVAEDGSIAVGEEGKKAGKKLYFLLPTFRLVQVPSSAMYPSTYKVPTYPCHLLPSFLFLVFPFLV
jgi:hypothetical protein